MFPAARDSFLRILQIRSPNAVSFKARLTKMRCGPLRLGRDFGRSFTHHFWCHFGGQFGPLFEAPLERRCAGISVFSGFGVLVGTRFRTSFGPCFRQYFPALENPTMLPTA